MKSTIMTYHNLNVIRSKLSKTKQAQPNNLEKEYPLQFKGEYCRLGFEYRLSRC